MAWACGFKKCDEFHMIYMDVSENSGFSPKSSILIRFSIINHPFWGASLFLGNIFKCTLGTHYINPAKPLNVRKDRRKSGAKSKAFHKERWCQTCQMWDLDLG